MLKKIVFDWDQWNSQKNEIKHGVSIKEAESVFFDPQLKIFEDIKHSTGQEKRYIAHGLSLERRILMVGFTIRANRFRVITARPASKTERKIYDKE